MKPQLLLLPFVLVVFISCKQKSSDKKETKQTDIITRDSVEIRNTVTDFYTWYSRNYEKFFAYDLYDGVKKKDEPPYKINWDIVEKYQAFIRDSVPQLGAAFLENQRTLFKKADSAFKVDVEDDVPYYFDYDWYTNTQEDPAYLLEEMNKSKQWLISVRGEEATVDIKGFDENGTRPAATVVNLLMKKENGKWKIAKIGND